MSSPHRVLGNLLREEEKEERLVYIAPKPWQD